MRSHNERMQTTTLAPSAADIRAELARRRVKLYLVAAAVHVHPVRLGQMLAEKVVLAPELAERVMRAIEAEAATK